MVSRIRSRGSGSFSNGGYCYRHLGSGVQYNSLPYYQLIEDCADVIGDYGNDHPFDLTRTRRHVTPMNGVYYLPNGSIGTEYYGYIHSRTGGTPPGVIVPPTSDSALVPPTLARTNPSRPYADLGVFVGELRDFPGMAKQVWDGVRSVTRFVKPNNRNLNQAAKEVISSLRPDKAYLASEFGWKPFVSDIMKYMDTQALVNRRIVELEKLRNTGMSKAKVTLFESFVTDGGSVVSVSSTTGVTIKAFETKSAQTTQWGTSKWYLESTGRLAAMRSLNDVEKLARETALGITVDSSTLWNLMPWSWLGDWGSNMGDWLESKRNIIGASSSGACIMTRQTTSCIGSRPQGIDAASGVTGGDYYAIRERKRRSIHSPSTLPEMTVPILTGRQTAILGSLATTRIIR